jgi:WD40 repeat protein
MRYLALAAMTLGLHSGVVFAQPRASSVARSASTAVAQPREVRVIDAKAHGQGLSFSPDGSKIAGAFFDGFFRVWDVSDGSLLSEMKVPLGQGQRITWSPDGSFLIGASRRGVVWLLDAQLKQSHQLFKDRSTKYAVFHASLTPDCRHIVLCFQHGRIVVLNSDGKSVADFNENRRLRSIAITSGGSMMAVCPGKGPIHFYDLPNCDTAKKFVTGLPEHGDVAFADQDETLVVSGTNGHLKRWDISRSSVFATADVEERPLWLSTHPDGERVLVGCADSGRGMAYVWSQEYGSVELPKLDGAVHAIAWGPTGRLAAFAAHDRTIRIWEVQPPYSKRATLNADTQAALDRWKSHLFPDKVASADVPKIVPQKLTTNLKPIAEDSAKLLVRQAQQKVLTALSSKNPTAARKTLIAVSITKSQTMRIIDPSKRIELRNIIDTLQQDSMSAVQSGGVKLRLIGGSRAKFSVHNVRTSELTKGEKRLLSLMPENLPVFNAVFSILVGGRRVNHTFGTFVILENRQVRMLPPIDHLSRELDHADARANADLPPVDNSPPPSKKSK